MTVLEFLRNNYENTSEKENLCKYCLEYEALGVCSSLLCEKKNNLELGEIEG